MITPSETTIGIVDNHCSKSTCNAYKKYDTELSKNWKSSGKDTQTSEYINMYD